MTSKNPRKYHPKNERIKREYHQFLAEVDQKSPVTIDGIMHAIVRFERHTNFKDFAVLHREQIIAFKKKMHEEKNARTGKPLSKSTLHSIMNGLKAFFRWLLMQPGYKSKINPLDIGYFNLSERDISIAKSSLPKKSATIQQVQQVLAAMPSDTIIQQRDRALVAFTILTAARVKALASLKIKHVNMAEKLVVQDPKEVQTKFANTILTYFMPLPITVGDKTAVDIVAAWLETLHQLGFTENDPLFPRNRVTQDSNFAFESVGLETQSNQSHWQTTEPIRRIFRKAFVAAGLPYFNPHTFRNTLMLYAEEQGLTTEQLKALSQNFGHKSPLVTLCSYGELPPHRQAKAIASIGEQPAIKASDVQQALKVLGKMQLTQVSPD